MYTYCVFYLKWFTILERKRICHHYLDPTKKQQQQSQRPKKGNKIITTICKRLVNRMEKIFFILQTISVAFEWPIYSLVFSCSTCYYIHCVYYTLCISLVFVHIDCGRHRLQITTMRLIRLENGFRFFSFCLGEFRITQWIVQTLLLKS